VRIDRFLSAEGINKHSGSFEEMQAPTTSQRSIQRRSPAADPGPPPTVPVRSMSPGGGPQPRTSSSSVKSIQNGSGSRRHNVSMNPESTERSISRVYHIKLEHTCNALSILTIVNSSPDNPRRAARLLLLCRRSKRV
jgi:hypothetical protein